MVTILEYIRKDTTYSIIAKTETIKRFEPSGSSIARSIVLEDIQDVKAKINNETFFDGVYIGISILECIRCD